MWGWPGCGSTVKILFSKTILIRTCKRQACYHDNINIAAFLETAAREARRWDRKFRLGLAGPLLWGEDGERKGWERAGSGVGWGGALTGAGGEPGGRKVQKPRRWEVSRVRGSSVHQLTQIWKSGCWIGRPCLRHWQSHTRKPGLGAIQCLICGRARRVLVVVLLLEFSAQSPSYSWRLAPQIRLVHSTPLYICSHFI